MDETDKGKSSSRYLWILIAAIIFLTRAPGLILAGPDRLLNDSEFEMTLGMLDRFLGVPSSVLIWPAGPLHILALPVFGMDFLFSREFALTPAAFVAYLANMYREPFHALLLVRLTVAIISSLCFAALYQPFSRLLESRTAGLLAAAIPATIPILWSHSHMAVPDSPAFALVCAAAAPLLAAEVRQKHLVIGGVLAGLAVSAKVTVIPSLPFIFALALQNYESKRRAFLMFAASLCVGFAVGCPYLWTDPVRLVKTVVGNAARQGNAMGLARALSTTVEVIPLWLLAIMIVGLAALVRRRRFWLLAGSVLTVAMTIKIVAGAGVTFPRYLLPIAPVAGVLTVVALVETRQWLGVRPYAKAGISLILALIVIGNAAIYTARLPGEMNDFRVINEVVKDIESLDRKSSIIVPYDNFFYYFAGRSSSESLQRLGDDCAAVMVEGRKVAEFASKSGLPQDAVAALPRVFDSQEQDFVAQARVMSYPGDREGFDLRLWVADDLAPRFGFLTKEQALSLFEKGEVDAIVINKKPDGLIPTKSYGDKCFLFVRSQQPGEGLR